LILLLLQRYSISKQPKSQGFIIFDCETLQ